MKTNHPRSTRVAAALLLICGSGMASTDTAPGAGVDGSQAEPTVRHAKPAVVTPAATDLVRLEESLQWTGRKSIELPVSLFVTDLLPGQC